MTTFDTPATTVTDGVLRYTNPVQASTITDHILGKFIEYSNYTGSVLRHGYATRRTQQTDSEFPNHMIVVGEDGYVSFMPLESAQIHAIHPTSVKPMSNLINQIGFVTYEKRNIATYANGLQRQIDTKNSELTEWEEKVKRACKEAEERGYCSEFDRIAEAAGFDMPQKEEFEIEVEVTITVTITKEAWTLEKAKEMVEYDDISSAISGEDSIDNWELK